MIMTLLGTAGREVHLGLCPALKGKSPHYDTKHGVRDKHIIN
jgi:hypothetical protein